MKKSKTSKSKKKVSSEFRIERWNQPHQPNSAMMLHILVTEGYRVFQWAERPETFYGSRKYAADHSHWVVSGALEINLESKGIYTLQAGDRDFMPAEMYHTARVVGEEPLIYLVGEKINS